MNSLYKAAFYVSIVITKFLLLGIDIDLKSSDVSVLWPV